MVSKTSVYWLSILKSKWNITSKIRFWLFYAVDNWFSLTSDIKTIINHGKLYHTNYWFYHIVVLQFITIYFYCVFSRWGTSGRPVSDYSPALPIFQGPAFCFYSDVFLHFLHLEGMKKHFWEPSQRDKMCSEYQRINFQ